MDLMGGTSDRLQERSRRRAEWVAGAAGRFEEDDRVAAAWVFGSEGRGDADELSDLEVFVVVADEVAESVLAAFDGSTCEAFGDVLSFADASERAPEGGRAFVVTYPAPVEPLTVGWWFQRAGAVQRGSDVRVLVDKVGVAAADPPLPTKAMLPEGGATRAGGPGGSRAHRSGRRVERVQERVTWFWATAPRVAKWLARGWTDRADAELERMAVVVEEAMAFLNVAPSERSADPGPVRPLARLRAVMVELSQLGDGLVDAGVDVPALGVAYGWLELAEDLEQERWTPNSPK